MSVMAVATASVRMKRSWGMWEDTTRSTTHTTTADRAWPVPRQSSIPWGEGAPADIPSVLRANVA